MTDITMIDTLNFNLLPLLPEIFLTLTSMGLLIVGVCRGNESTGVIRGATIAALALSLLLLLGATRHLPTPVSQVTVLSDMFVFDHFAAFTKFLIVSGLIAALALSSQYLGFAGIRRFEYPVLITLSGVGMMLMVSSHNMLGLYMGLELQSLSLYVLAAFQRGQTQSAEAGIKYFVLGALSSGLLLFGISLIYGFTGMLGFEQIAESLKLLGHIPPGVVVGLVFVLSGLAFKISAVPFHMWTPDVYQGAPTSVTALFAIVPKVAAFALLMRLLFGPFGTAVFEWQQIIYGLSLASMIVGAFAGIAQSSLKRLLAYSSIGHMGYALIGLVTATPAGAGAVILYLLVYMIMTAGVFAIVLTLRRDGRSLDHISDLKGLSAHHPGLCYAMAILMFSMSGIPPLAGFFSKLVIFQVAVAGQFYALAILGIVSSVVAAYYYLRIIKVMFFDTDGYALDDGVQMPLARRIVLLVSLCFVLGFIVKPNMVIDYAQNSTAVLFKR